MAVELAPGVHWVGVVDWGIRRFHGHELSTHRGTTYNAYVIRDEKTVLVDTAWGPREQEFLAHLRSVVDPATIDYVVANHAEPDHSGSLPAVMRLCPRATLIVSRAGAQSIPGHYHASWNMRAVKTGDRLPLGRNALVFVEAPLLHWPDSMFTYLTGHNILMPNDAFGQHYATAGRFNDEVDTGELFAEAEKYYANILTPFSERVLKKIEELLALNLPVDMIAPSHGVIWRRDPLQIVQRYQEWAAQRPAPRAVVVYDSMWGATERMALAISAGLAEAGVDHKVFHAAVSDVNDVTVEIFRARLVLYGSPTHNGGLLSSIMPLIEHVKGLRMKNKIGAAFGSYGWSGEGPGLLEAHLRDSGIEVVRAGLRWKWQPAEDDLAAGRALGRELGALVRER